MMKKIILYFFIGLVLLALSCSASSNRPIPTTTVAPTTSTSTSTSTTTMVAPTTTTQPILKTVPTITRTNVIPQTNSCAVGEDRPNSCNCTWALEYLYSHKAPGFTPYCPHWALGHQAGTCYNYYPYCSGSAQIWIWVVCWASVANEAWNSNHVLTGPYDPWGYCH